MFVFLIWNIYLGKQFNTNFNCLDGIFRERDVSCLRHFLMETFVSRIIEGGIIRLLLFLFKAVGTFYVWYRQCSPGLTKIYSLLVCENKFSKCWKSFCQRLSLHLLRWSYGFYFWFVNVVYYIDWFADIEESLHPWDKAHLIMMYDLFNVLLDSDC